METNETSWIRHWSTVGISTSTGATEDCSLTFEEESTIHNVGGYVIRQLKIDKANVQMLPLLEQLTYSESSPVDDDPMRHWVNQVDRGELTKITMLFDVFIISKSQFGIFS